MDMHKKLLSLFMKSKLGLEWSTRKPTRFSMDEQYFLVEELSNCISIEIS